MFVFCFEDSRQNGVLNKASWEQYCGLCFFFSFPSICFIKKKKDLGNIIQWRYKVGNTYVLDYSIYLREVD